MYTIWCCPGRQSSRERIFREIDKGKDEMRIDFITITFRTKMVKQENLKVWSVLNCHRKKS